MLFKLQELIKKHKFFLLLIFVYFSLRLVNLTLLPIFNDEAIYLDWGWRETHISGFLYYSLYDAKQPLLMWIFGIMQNFFNDPLFAGRLVSVFTGFLTMSGIYYFSQKNINQKTAILALILYIFIPIFSFYDRQALMESSIAACGVWSLVFLSNFIQEKKILSAVFLGIVLGIGFFTKSSSLIFLVTSVLILLIYFINENKKQIFLQGLVAALISFSCIAFLLIINPQFWQTLSKNYVFTLSPSELLGFPILKWILNFWGDLQISFLYLTPFIFLAAVFGFVKVIKDRYSKLFVVLFYVLFSLIINILLSRIVSDRYLVSFLPFACVLAAYGANSIFIKNKILGGTVFTILLIPIFFVTLVQITNPPIYLQETIALTQYNLSAYLNGVTSGYGINETVNYIKTQQKDKPFIVAYAENTGNPESAMVVYFNYMKLANVKSAYLDRRLFGNALDGYNCLSSKDTLYFVSREQQLGGMDNFLQKLTTIKNPYGANTIGIYTLKQNCKGKTFNLVLTKTAS